MNNNGNRVIKQINRVATPIRLDANGNKIENSTPVTNNQVVNTQPQVNTFVNQKLSATNTVRKGREHDSSFAIFITVILLMLCAGIAYISYIFLPHEVEYPTSTYQYNDQANVNTYVGELVINEYTIGDGINPVTNINKILDTTFRVEINNKKEVYVNKVKVNEASMILPKIIRINDVLVLIVKEDKARTNRLLAFNKNGGIVYEMFCDDKYPGFTITDDGLSVQNNKIMLHLTRVDGSKFYSNLTYGSTDSSSVCSTLDTNKVDMTIPLEYRGNTYLELGKEVSSKTAKEYKLEKGVCN